MPNQAISRPLRYVIQAWAGLVILGLAISLACGPARAREAPIPTNLPQLNATASDVDYRIGALDKLNIAVFQVQALTVDKLQVDAGGQILLPLIGSVMARGKTTTELSAEIAARLATRYMQAPQVSVTVEEAVSQKISVEGAVNEAGVFDLKGRTSLLEAVARAKGASKAADLHQVTIIRNVDGQPHAASFDLAAIGAGRARDPEVVGNDVVIVGDSRGKSIWNGFVQVLPLLYIFSYL